MDVKFGRFQLAVVKGGFFIFGDFRFNRRRIQAAGQFLQLWQGHLCPPEQHPGHNHITDNFHKRVGVG